MGGRYSKRGHISDALVVDPENKEGLVYRWGFPRNRGCFLHLFLKVTKDFRFQRDDE